MATLAPRPRGKRTKIRVRQKGPWNGLGISAQDTFEAIQRVREGFPYSAIARFNRSSGLTLSQIARLVRIPPRTLIRRKAEGRLMPDESERLLRLAGIFEQAVRLFAGDIKAARTWLATPRSVLDGQTPLDFAGTEIGAREVEDLIGRLEHGVFT
jgi:putative toxin-antitoxin system antitoxin component (TIGR02293 family)